jgi:cold shock CspA family protein
MTTGTVHQFNPTKGTGTVCCVAGTLVPFSSRGRDLAEGDRVSFRLVGGMTGLYALDVERAGAPARHRQTATSSSPLRSMSGTLAPAAG